MTEPLSPEVRAMMVDALCNAGKVSRAEVWIWSDRDLAELFYDFTEQRGQ